MDPRDAGQALSAELQPYLDKPCSDCKFSLEGPRASTVDICWPPKSVQNQQSHC